MKDSPAAGQLSEGDIWFSRYNVHAAKDQNVLRSLLGGSTADSTNNPQDQDDESDFKGTREVAGLGAVNQDEDSELNGILKRKRTDNDKLLENLMGKKAAEAHKKARKAEPGTSMSVSKHAAPKSVNSSTSKSKPQSRPQDSDEEEEVGRAGAFTSKKKTRDAKVPAYVTTGGKAAEKVDPDAEPPDSREEIATVKELVKQDGEEDMKPKKRKVGSYLDEVLGKRGKRGKKKKKGKGGGN